MAVLDMRKNCGVLVNLSNRIIPIGLPSDVRSVDVLFAKAKKILCLRLPTAAREVPLSRL
jgi:hypothetical protein